MATNNEGQDPSFKLGKIEQGVESLLHDMRAVRDELGHFGQRVAATETGLAEIKAERAVLMREYDKEKHRTNNHIQKVEAYMATQAGERSGLSLGAKIAIGLGGLLLPLTGFQAAKMISPAAAVQHIQPR